MKFFEKVFGGGDNLGTDPKIIEDLEKRTAEIDEAANKGKAQREAEIAGRIEELEKKITDMKKVKDEGLTVESLQEQINQIQADRDKIQQQEVNEDSNLDKSV